MATKAKIIKQENDLKTEARSKLNKALEEAVEEEQQDIMGSEEEEQEEEMLDEDMVEEIDSKKNIKKILHEQYEQQEEQDEEEPMDEDDGGDYITLKKESGGKKQIQAPQASYIMKLFDRSVNLAKFEEDTPLYPLCRAWMKNQPRAPTIKSEKTTDPIIQTVEEGDVVEMPKIRIRKGKQVLTRKDNKLDTKDFDKIIDSEVWTKEKLLEYHRKQWLEEKSRQIETYRLFEEKHFTANLQLLDTLRKDTEEY